MKPVFQTSDRLLEPNSMRSGSKLYDLIDIKAKEKERINSFHVESTVLSLPLHRTWPQNSQLSP
jgi:hypothetical protein